MYENAQYFNSLDGEIKGIKITIDGTVIFILSEPENNDYNNIMRLVAEGKLTIAPAE